jgi:hypothetical protein
MCTPWRQNDERPKVPTTFTTKAMVAGHQIKIKCFSATTLKLKHENLRNFVALGAWLELYTKHIRKNSKAWYNHRYLYMYNIEICGNNEHLRALMTMRLRTCQVVHGGLSSPSTMTADTQRTATHCTKIIKKKSTT